MLKFGRIHASALVMCGMVLAVVFFIAGFVSAMLLGGLDRETALAVPATAVESSEMLAEERNELLFQATYVARSPAYAVAELARRPVNLAQSKLPGAIQELRPLQALDDAISRREEAAAQAISGETEAAFDSVEGVIAGEVVGETPAGDQAAASGETADGDPAADRTSDADAAAADASPEAAEQEIERRVLPPAVPARGDALYSIELASFRSPAAAETFVAEMQERSVPVALVEQADLSGRVWLHVRTGAYPTPEAAQLRLRDLRRQQGLEGIVVSEAKAGPSS